MIVALFPIPHPVLNTEQSTVVPKNLKYEMQMPLKIGKYIFERVSICSIVKWSLCCSLSPAIPLGLNAMSCPLVNIVLFTSQCSELSLLILGSHYKHSLWRHTGGSQTRVWIPALLLAGCVTRDKFIFTSLSHPFILISKRLNEMMWGHSNKSFLYNNSMSWWGRYSYHSSLQMRKQSHS